MLALKQFARLLTRVLDKDLSSIVFASSRGLSGIIEDILLSEWLSKVAFLGSLSNQLEVRGKGGVEIVTAY